MAKLYKNSLDISTTHTYADEKIRNYIFKNESEDFDEFLIQDNSFETFFHLSKTRQSILNWYEFKEDAELLEIGGGFGALTGLFCDKCSWVTCIEKNEFRAESILKRYKNRKNLEIFTGSETNLCFSRKYDYIVLLGVLEYRGYSDDYIEKSIKYLNWLKSLLKPNGAILIATENRMGLRYLCGASYPSVKNSFDGINKNFNENEKCLFTKSEVINIIDKAGLCTDRFYYPVPDYRFTQEVYSDNYKPKGNLKERIIPYYLNGNSLIADEMLLYDDIIENNVFEVFSNSFFVECRKEEYVKNNSKCTIDYVAVSTDRKAENAYATIIYDNKNVVKKPLFLSGIRGIMDSYHNISQLKTRGLEIVPTEIKERMLIMPFYEEQTLMKCLSCSIKTDKEKALILFDKLYNDILKSSEHADSKLCYFNKFKDVSNDMGVILKNAYIDMIPINCFYKDKKIIYFDQEFKKDYFPASYIMFRAIKYMYLSLKESDKKLLTELELRMKYNLNHLWDFYEVVEGKFVSENRQYNIYKNYISWSYVNKNKILENSKLLGGLNNEK